ncbi:MAG: ABC transporter permease [Trebonia sp.]
MSAVALPGGSLPRARVRPAPRAHRATDVLVLTARNLAHIARQPLRLSDVTIQPLVFTALFVYVFGAGITVGGGYVQFALAGLLGMNLVTSATGTAIGLSTDLTTGVIDRFRVLPVWRPAILVGRTLSDLLGAILCSACVAATGLVMSWRPDGGVPDAIAGFALFLLFSYAVSWGCACIALATDGPEAAQGLSLLVLFPSAFVSNALVPTAHMPLVIRAVAVGHAGVVGGAARRLRPARGQPLPPPRHRLTSLAGEETAQRLLMAGPAGDGGPGSIGIISRCQGKCQEVADDIDIGTAPRSARGTGGE